MPYRYARKTYSRKPRSKTFKKTYKKKRFSKKTFVKSTLNRTTIKPTTYSRELYQKLKWVKLESMTAPLTSSVRRFYLGNSSSPYPPQGALSAFAGPAAAIPAGEQYPGGFVENASFYDKHNVLGSSIKVTGFLTTTASGVIGRAVFIPIMPSPDDANDSIDNMINQLDAYTFDQLMSYPQAQMKTLTNASNNNCKFFFKAFRKTKSMLQLKDIKDNTDLRCDMPDTSGALGQRPSSTLQWGYYIRVFNSTGTAYTVETTVEMKLYIRYFQRRYVQAITST